MNWHRLSRFFHLEGNFGGLQYDVRGGILELNSIETIVARHQMVATPTGVMLADSWASECSNAPALQVWESEGGQVGQPR